GSEGEAAQPRHDPCLAVERLGLVICHRRGPGADEPGAGRRRAPRRHSRTPRPRETRASQSLDTETDAVSAQASRYATFVAMSITFSNVRNRGTARIGGS